MLENIVMALITGIVIPIVLETWRNRRDRVRPPAPTVEASPTVTSTAAAAPTPSRAGRPVLRAVARLFLAGLIGVFIAVVISVLLAPESADTFSTGDGVLSAIAVAIVWFILGKVGPLKYRA